MIYFNEFSRVYVFLHKVMLSKMSQFKTPEIGQFSLALFASS